MTDWFLIILATTVVLRGLGAGFISGVVLMTLPPRKKMGLIPYARFIRTMYEEPEVKGYGVLTTVGMLLTVWLAIWTFGKSEPALVSWSIVASLIATLLGFVGTAGALPPMFRLWKTPDNDEALIATLLDRFGRWGTFSTVWHVCAFIILVVALTKA